MEKLARLVWGASLGVAWLALIGIINWRLPKTRVLKWEFITGGIFLSLWLIANSRTMGDFVIAIQHRPEMLEIGTPFILLLPSMYFFLSGGIQYSKDKSDFKTLEFALRRAIAFQIVTVFIALARLYPLAQIIWLTRNW